MGGWHFSAWRLTFISLASNWPAPSQYNMLILSDSFLLTWGEIESVTSLTIQQYRYIVEKDVSRNGINILKLQDVFSFNMFS